MRSRTSTAHVERQLAEAALVVGERAVDELPQIGLAQRLEPHHLAARQERGVDLERRVLRGRADERDRARLDVRQERVLLRLVEAMDLVEEEHRALAVLGQPRLGRGDRLAQILDARLHRREPDEVRAAPAPARMRASVVLPVPGGPHKMSDGSARSAAVRSRMRPGPTRCAWPTNSSRSRGRMRSASGCPVRLFFAA